MAPDDAKPNRRSMLTRVGLFGLFTSMGMTIVGSARFLLPKLFYEPRLKFKIGRPPDFPKGSSRLLPERKVFVVHDDDGLYVVSAICSHLGCIASKTPQGFKCPCHGSKFDAQGYVLSGPAPQPLAWLKVNLSLSGYLVVDAGQTVEVGTKFQIG